MCKNYVKVKSWTFFIVYPSKLRLKSGHQVENIGSPIYLVALHNSHPPLNNLYIGSLNLLSYTLISFVIYECHVFSRTRAINNEPITKCWDSSNKRILFYLFIFIYLYTDILFVVETWCQQNTFFLLVIWILKLRGMGKKYVKKEQRKDEKGK